MKSDIMNLKIQGEYYVINNVIEIKYKTVNTIWQPIITCIIDSCIDYGFIGGAYYVKNRNKFSLEEIKNVSLMPYYCYSRIYPQKYGEEWIHSCIYVKMPLFCVEYKNRAYGLSFEPKVSVDDKEIPLSFSSYSKNDITIFKLGIFNDFRVYMKRKEDYIDWNSGELVLHKTMRYNLKNKKVKLNIKKYESDDWKKIVHEYVTCKLLEDYEINYEFHLNKTLNWLYSVYDPEYKVFHAWKWREKRGFKLGFWVLPLYNTLASDMYLLSLKLKDPKINEIAEGAKKLLLHKDASVLFKDGRVWHNSLGLSSHRKKLNFFTHLGTGLAGYPGGQAVVVRTLLERIKYGDADNELITKTRQGLDWLINNLYDDGHWARTFYVFKEYSPFKLETGEKSYSVGANAEGVITLLLGYDVFKEIEYLEKGLLALDWVNEFAKGGVITSGYLRDNKQEEVDGVSAIFAVQANLMAYNITGQKKYLDFAKDFGYYMTTWQRWWDIPSFDTLIFSFSPRVAPCETVWAAEAYLDLYNATKEAFWFKLSEKAFSAIDYENKYVGYSEAIYYDENLELHPLHFDCIYTASAVLRYLLKRQNLNISKIDINASMHYKEAHTSCISSYLGWSFHILRSILRRVKRAYGRL